MSRLNLRIAPIDWHPRYSYVVTGLQVNGQRKRLYFKTAREAEEELLRLKIKARRHGQAGLDMPDELRAMAAECARQLAPYSKTIRDATEYYMRYLSAAASVQIGSSLVDDYVRAQERAQFSERHLHDIVRRLGRFQQDFAGRPVRTIAAREIEEWLYGRTLANGHDQSAQTVVNWRSTLHSFFRWLLRQKAVDFNPVEAVAKPRVIRGAPAIWAPADLERLLKAAPPELVPVLAIGAFAGLRASELFSLEWSEISLDRGLIEIKAAKAKTARRRLCAIQPNLKDWLAPYAGHTGLVWPQGWRSYYDAVKRLCGDLGLEWPENGLRHSFASYHLAHFQSAETLSLQMGHTSTGMIFDHYREVVTPQAAQLYWGIRP